MQPVRVAPALHHAAGKLVDDHHLAVAHQVVDVAREQPVRAQRLIDVVDQGDVRDVVQLRVLQQLRLGQPLLHLLGAAFDQRHRALLLVLLVVLLAKARDEAVDLAVQLGAVLGRAGDDQRRARLVDQDAVDLVDDAEVEARWTMASRVNFMLSRR